MNAQRNRHVAPAPRADGGVGTAKAHDSAPLHVTGEAVYVDDIAVPSDTLHAHIALSDVAHGRLTSLDIAAVRAAPGVVDVITAADVPGVNDVSPIAGDDPMLAADTISYNGQALFAVAAETQLQARRAAKHAVVDIDAGSPIVTIDQAMDAGSLLGPPEVMESGDLDDALARTPHRLQGRLYIGGQEHLYLEGQAALAIPGEGRDVTVHASTQHPTEIQHKVAHVLGLASHDVTVEVRRMGGAFGGKESQGNLPACIAALLAVRTRRPVKVVYDRDDDMRVTGKRHDFRIDYDVGFDDHGRITALDVTHAIRCGMSWDLSEPIGDRAMFHADNCYFLEHARITSYRCKTHTASNTAFRGFGGPQGMIGMERIIDHVAYALGRDALAVRRANFYDHRDAPAPKRRTTPYNMAVEDCIIQDLADGVARTSHYAARCEEIAAWNAANPVLKKGIALTPVRFGISFTKTFLNQAGALVHVYNDGSIGLNHGGTEMGQGLFTKVAQVVAEEFQVDADRVKITATTTGKVPNTSATAASSGADLNGMAAANAARKIKTRIAAHLAEQHQAAPEDVRFLPGRIAVGGQEMSFDDAVMSAYMARVPLSATGFYATPKIGWNKQERTGRPFFYFAYGAAVTEAVIDTLTGENRLLRADILHDVGRSLNPAIDRGQIEGGYVQGAGWLTTEELVWDAAGALKTHAPSTYKIPTSADRPPELNIAIYDRGANAEETVYRSKAVGEPPFMLAISAFFAISDAIARAGGGQYPDLQAPATPERVLAALKASGLADAAERFGAGQ